MGLLYSGHGPVMYRPMGLLYFGHGPVICRPIYRPWACYTSAMGLLYVGQHIGHGPVIHRPWACHTSAMGMLYIGHGPVICRPIYRPWACYVSAMGLLYIGHGPIYRLVRSTSGFSATCSFTRARTRAHTHVRMDATARTAGPERSGGLAECAEGTTQVKL